MSQKPGLFSNLPSVLKLLSLLCRCFMKCIEVGSRAMAEGTREEGRATATWETSGRWKIAEQNG